MATTPASRPIAPMPPSGDHAKMPLSPHLQIWKFTPTMAASITQRATGVANFAGTALLAAWAFAASRSEAFFTPFANFLTSPFGGLILFGFIWSLSFHMLGGLRYLYADTGRGLEKNTSTRVALAVFVGSLILAAIVTAAALAARSSV